MSKSSKQTPLLRIRCQHTQDESHRRRCQNHPKSRFTYCHIVLFKNSYLLSNCNSENIKNVPADHGRSLGITCAWLHFALYVWLVVLRTSQLPLLYEKATIAVQMNGSIGEWFRKIFGERQGCLLSPTLFNIFLERIMSDALEEHGEQVSKGGRNITNLRSADDIDALAEEEQELEAMVESLEKPAQGIRWRSVQRRPN